MSLLIVGSFFSFLIVAPQTAFALNGCGDEPGNAQAADAQLICINNYRAECKNLQAAGFCNSLSLGQINSCARNVSGPNNYQFREPCLQTLADNYVPEEEEMDTGLTAEDCVGDDLNKGNCGIINLVITITNVMSGIAGLVIVSMLILAGIRYSSAGADPSKVQAAKGMIINAITALLLLIFGYSLLQWLVPGGIF